MDKHLFYTVLGGRIAIFRQAHNWTQAELAEKIGKPRTFIVHLESGQATNVSAWDLIRLAATLDRPVQDLFPLFHASDL